jgi:hypothetical protein
MHKENSSKDRKAKHMLWLPVAVVLLSTLAVILTPVVRRHIAIDRCLDAGGAFDYKTDKCVEGLQK